MILRLQISFLLLLLLVVGRQVLCQNQSPCPNIFTYEPKGTEKDRWYGRITLTTPDELNGIWLKVSLDRPAELLGNWFGDATSSDNRDYLIKNPQYRLQPNHEPLTIRFFVKYDPKTRNIPSIASIRLNGRIVCPTGMSDAATTSSTLHISQLKPAESSSNSNNKPGVGNSGSYNRPSNNNNNNHQTTAKTTVSSNDDDYFSGDFGGSGPNIVSNSNVGVRSDSCGTVKVGARPLITHGEPTHEGEFPWHIALYRYKGADMKYICGGSLISETRILTAAHCVTKTRTATPINPELLVAYLGKYNLYKVDPPVQSIQITKIVVHPEFNGTFLYNDLAVLQLESPAEITDYVRTVCLWEGDSTLHNIVERLGTVVGWGFDQTGELTENLMMAKMPVVSTETCVFSKPEFFSRFTSKKSFCAGFINGTSACTGDSGGGMVFPRSGTSGTNTVWQIRGLVSLSVALQNDKLVCDTSAYIVFTDVAKYVDWIRRTMSR